MKQPASTATAPRQGLGGQLGEMVALLRAGRCGGRILLLIAGLWLIVAGRLPLWLQAGVALGVAAYSIVFAVNISRQRQPPPRAGASNPDRMNP